MNSGLCWFNKEILDQQSAGISPFLKLTSLTSAIKEASPPSISSWQTNSKQRITLNKSQAQLMDAGHEKYGITYYDHAMVRTQKKITVLFGNFSQMADPPPFWEPLIQKKILSFILHFRPLGTFLVFTKKLKFCQYFYIYFWE